MNLPIDRVAELGVVGACLDGGLETTLVAAEKVPARCFYHDDIRFCYEHILSAAASGRHSDTAWLHERWKAAFPTQNAPWDALNAQDTHGKWTLDMRAETVTDLYKRRQAMIAAHALLSGAEKLDTPLNESVGEFAKIMDASHTDAPPLVDGRAAAHALTDDCERRHQLQGALSGIDTGFPKLNAITQGLQQGEVWVIGARPGTGKTAIALNIAAHCAITNNVPCLFVSLEMTAVAITRRLASMVGNVNASAIRSGILSEGQINALTSFNAKLSKSPLHILDSPGGIGITQLCNSVRAAIRRFGIKVVFLDYIQKVRPDSKGEKRTYEISDTSARLVALAKTENVNLFALAQLNRESEKDKGRPPKLSDLADSKSIEADADLVGLLQRPFNGNENMAVLRIAKQRDGELDSIPLEFRGWICQFVQGSWMEEPK